MTREERQKLSREELNQIWEERVAKKLRPRKILICIDLILCIGFFIAWLIFFEITDIMGFFMVLILYFIVTGLFWVFRINRHTGEVELCKEVEWVRLIKGDRAAQRCEEEGQAAISAVQLATIAMFRLSRAKDEERERRERREDSGDEY